MSEILVNTIKKADGTGSITVPADSGTLLTSATSSITKDNVDSTVLITRGTAVSASGSTAVEFTSIPSGVKKITVVWSYLSTNGSDVPIIQIGDSGGYETTGYGGGGAYVLASNSNSAGTRTDGLLICGNAWGPAATAHGAAVLYNIDGNTWTHEFGAGQSEDGVGLTGGGSKTLSATLDRLRVTTPAGSNTFDNGTVQIMYEY